MGADGEVYAVSQGQVAVAGFSASGNASTVVKGVPTSGRIANGAIIERELGFELEQLRSVKLALRNPDLTTARRIAEAINAFTGEGSARSLRSEEHTSELQSLMRISYAVFCLQKTTNT